MAGRRSSRAIAPGRAPGNKGRRYPPEILTVEEVRALIAGCSNRAPTGVRNRALIVVLYRGGLRLEEALGLMARDVDARRGTVNVRHGKGDKHRVVGMDPEAFAVLERWIETTRRLGAVGPRAAVFCTLTGAALSDVSPRAAVGLPQRRGVVDTGVGRRCVGKARAGQVAELRCSARCRLRLRARGARRRRAAVARGRRCWRRRRWWCRAGPARGTRARRAVRGVGDRAVGWCGRDWVSRWEGRRRARAARPGRGCRARAS